MLFYGISAMWWRAREKSEYFQATLGVGILWIATQMIAAPGAQLSSCHTLYAAVWASLLFFKTICLFKWSKIFFTTDKYRGASGIHFRTAVISYLRQ